MRHDPLLVAIYSKRQPPCHLGAYVIRKMTPFKTWLPRRLLRLCASFLFFSLVCFGFVIYLAYIFMMLYDRRAWLRHINTRVSVETVSVEAYSFQGFTRPQVISPLASISSSLCKSQSKHTVICQPSVPCRLQDSVNIWPRETILHLLLVSR